MILDTFLVLIWNLKFVLCMQVLHAQLFSQFENCSFCSILLLRAVVDILLTKPWYVLRNFNSNNFFCSSCRSTCKTLYIKKRFKAYFPILLRDQNKNGHFTILHFVSVELWRNVIKQTGKQWTTIWYSLGLVTVLSRLAYTTAWSLYLPRHHERRC